MGVFYLCGAPDGHVPGVTFDATRSLWAPLVHFEYCARQWFLPGRCS